MTLEKKNEYGDAGMGRCVRYKKLLRECKVQREWYAACKQPYTRVLQNVLL